MTVTVGGTNITFNDATTQTTAPVNTNANVNSITAGTGISVNASTGAVTISATGGGTVTSVATGNGLSGGTITTSGTLVIAAPTRASVGSYVYALYSNNGSTIGRGSTTAGSNLYSIYYSNCVAGWLSFSFSGTWRFEGDAGCTPTGVSGQGLFVRIS
jgi:hypothetical protein